MGDPQPRVMLPQLGDKVVGDKSHCPRQSVQHDGDKGLVDSERGMMRMHVAEIISNSWRTTTGDERESHLEGQKHGTRSYGEG